MFFNKDIINKFKTVSDAFAYLKDMEKSNPFEGDFRKSFLLDIFKTYLNSPTVKEREEKISRTFFQYSSLPKDKEELVKAFKSTIENNNILNIAVGFMPMELKKAIFDVVSPILGIFHRDLPGIVAEFLGIKYKRTFKMRLISSVISSFKTINEVIYNEIK